MRHPSDRLNDYRSKLCSALESDDAVQFSQALHNRETPRKDARPCETRKRKYNSSLEFLSEFSDPFVLAVAFGAKKIVGRLL